MMRWRVTAKKLDVKIGDLVEIAGRKYDVVSDKHGGVALEPGDHQDRSTRCSRRSGLTALSKEEFEEQFGDLPSDGEG